MTEELKDTLISLVADVVRDDVLSIEDALAITTICRRAADRKIAETTELYMINAIGSEAQ